MEELNEQEPVTEEAAPEGDVTENTETAEADPFESGADSFDRQYVEKLRKESASYRTKAKEYEPLAQTFEPYGEEDRKVWAEAMRLFAEDPKAGAEYLDKIAKAVMSGYEQEQAEQQEPITDENDRPLTRAEYTQLREQERLQAEQDAEVSRIEREAVDLGYDTKSDEYTYLLTVASRLPSGSIAEAHSKIESAIQARVDAAFAAKAAEADGAGILPGESGESPSGETQIRTFQQARAAALARVAATR
jgi:hypothetical protein